MNTQNPAQLTEPDSADPGPPGLLAATERLAGTGSWFWDVEGERLWCSPGWLRAHGHPPAPRVLSELTAGVFADDRNLLESAVHAALAGRPSPPFDYRSPLPDGSVVWLRGHIVADFAGARVVALSGAVQDVTRERDLERTLEARVAERTRQLAAATAEAQAASAAKTTFLASMSHEIRTPMTAILGMAELLLEDELTSRQASRLGTICDAARHLLSVITNVLDLSRIEAGKLILEESAVDPERIVGSVLDMSADRARQQGLELLSQCQGVRGRLLGDPTRIRQALLNYVSNAIKFTPRGRVTIRTRCEEDSDEAVLLRFEVEDTGVGIEASAVERLFQLFEQGDDSRGKMDSGSGLGLAIVRQIAQAMGGGAGVDSELGRGSTFWFTTRLKRATGRRSPKDPGDAGRSRPASERRQHVSRILVVDDEWVNRDVIVAILETAGLSADCASHGREAVELASRMPYALILMDLQMPVMDGFEATRVIRQVGQNRDVPIVALSGNVFAVTRERCLHVGMNDFLAKPFAKDPLLELVTRWLRAERRGQR